MEWLTNTYNPNAADWASAVHAVDGQSRLEAARSLRLWLSDKHIGDPMPTNTYTVDQLRKMGMVGVYRG